MKRKNRFLLAGLCIALALVLVVLVRTCDVAPIGAAGTSIGLSHFNSAVFNALGVNLIWYRIADGLGIFAIMMALFFALVGLQQLIGRRSLFRVDLEIVLLGCLYLVAIGLYIMFEFVIVNYRPVLMPGCTLPESSFPSSHTVLVCVTSGSAIVIVGRYIKNAAVKKAVRIFCALVITVTVAARLLSGVHWATDIIGGGLISTGLVFLYWAVVPKRPKGRWWYHEKVFGKNR